MWRVYSLHQAGSVCNGAIWLQFLLKGNWWMPLKGTRSRKGALGSVSAVLKDMGVGTIESPGSGSTTMILPQLHHLPHWVAVSKLHHRFELQDAHLQSEDPRCCGVQMQSGKESGQHSARHKETDRWVRASLIFSSRKNTHTWNAKAPNKGLCA